MEILADLQEDLKLVQNLEPFILFFYGSRARDEEDVIFSDYNFFLLASSSDILRSDFKKQVTNLVNSHMPKGAVNISFNDFESFQMRMNLFDPVAVHIMEFGVLVFGEPKFLELKKQWEEIKKKPIKIDSLIEHLERRIAFYEKLKSEEKTLSETIGRIEIVILLRLQIIILSLVQDISISELAFFDMPTRFPELVTTMYKNELSEKIISIVKVYEELHEAKRITLLCETVEPEDEILFMNSVRRILINSQLVLQKLFQPA